MAIYQCSIETHQRILHYVHDTLIQQKRIPSIKESCAQLGITRTTFYLHFASMEEAKEALDRQCWEELLEMAAVYQKDPLQAKLLPFSFFFFEWLKKDLAYYQNITLCENHIYIEGMYHYLQDHLKECDSLHIAFIALGVLGFLEKWVEANTQIGAYEAAKQLDELLLRLK